MIEPVFRSISTKLLVAVLAAVALPVAGFAFLIEYRVADKLMLEMVLKTLQGLATDLAQQVDGELVDRRNDVAGWADEPLVWFATQDHLRELESLESGTAGFTTNWGLEQVVAHGDGLPIEESVANASLLRSALTDSFNSFLANRPELALVALIDTEGQLVTCNSTDADGRAMDPALLRRLFTKDWFEEPWFTVTLEEGEAAYNQHVPDWVVGEPEPEDFYIGLASAADGWPRQGTAYGVLYTLIEWRAFQQLVESSVIKAPFESLVAAGQVPSPYAWIWDADGDTILAHRDPALYGTTVSSIGLEQMVVDVQAGKSGQYREYEFRGERKRGAFHHGLEPSEGGFGWIVGVGIDNRDIDAATSDLRTELFQMTVVLLLLGVLLVMVIARRTTAPILALEEHTRRVSDGELGARIEIDSRDEVGRLAEAFNRMTQDLVQQREQLVRAEKDAAWREMARQIAHDIKNPLT
ncbi:MAG: PDC sensor domain-containing protein, partial [Planctomycetota bacterium]